MFTSEPQDVEVYSAGEWLPGALLGWRHDASGGCQVWVRLALGGAEESLWTDLECLRLPERHLAVAPEPRASSEPAAPARADDDPAATRSLRLAEVAATGVARRGRPAVAPVPRPARAVEARATRAVSAVRDDAASRAHHPAGRRRADSRVVGETAEFPAIASVGRHRAPAPSAGAGRHRAADTGVWPAVRDAEAEPRTPVAEGGGARRDATWPGHAPEPDLLTRPMRLGDVIPASRRPRRDETLAGA